MSIRFPMHDEKRAHPVSTRLADHMAVVSFEETKENGNLFFPAGFVMLPADDEVEMQPDVLLLQLVGDLQIDF